MDNGHHADKPPSVPFDPFEPVLDAGEAWRPEVILLFKAKGARPKDEDDFAAVLPQLDAPARQWLRETLALIHPEHHWIAILDNRSQGEKR